MSYLDREDLLDEKKALKTLLKQYRKNLFSVQEKESKYGIDVPTHITNEIDEWEEKIKRLGFRLKAIDEQLANLPPETESTPEIVKRPETQISETEASFKAPNLKNIYKLLINGFTGTKLRRFCKHTPDFKEVHIETNEQMGTDIIADKLLEYADRKVLIAPLLAWAKEESPARYKKYQPYYGTTINNVTEVVNYVSSPESSSEINLADVLDKTDLLTLQEAANQGNLVVLVGSGLSDLAGLPTWYEFVKSLAERIDYKLPPPEWVTADTLLDATQSYVSKRGLNELLRSLMEAVRMSSQKLSTAHSNLAHLPISLLFSATYDTLLERALQQADKQIYSVTKDSYIPLMLTAPNQVNIIKLYGDVQQPETIVATKEQFDKYFSTHPQILKLLESHLAQSTMLYVGWSHTDPLFNSILGQLINRMGNLPRRGYAVLFDIPQNKQHELERKQIKVLNLPPTKDVAGQLAAFFRLLY